MWRIDILIRSLLLFIFFLNSFTIYNRSCTYFAKSIPKYIIYVFNLKFQLFILACNKAIEFFILTCILQSCCTSLSILEVICWFSEIFYIAAIFSMNQSIIVLFSQSTYISFPFLVLLYYLGILVPCWIEWWERLTLFVLDLRVNLFSL